jgi:hypothetical protein
MAWEVMVGESGNIKIERIKKIVIYINSGLTGRVAEGYCWKDQIKLETS